MRSWKRLVFFLLLNICVSAATTAAVIYYWERSQDPAGVQNPVDTTEGLNINEISGGLAATVEPIPSPGYLVHIVQYGDTLASIAQTYDTSPDVLMQINGIQDVTAIGVGQEIFIPESESVSGTAGQGGSGEPTAGSQSNMEIEIVAVVGAGDLATERVLMRNIGEQEIVLEGWRLRGDQRQEYIFPRLLLFKGGTVNLHTASGVDSVTDLYWGRSEAAWAPGSELTLLDPQGKAREQFLVP